MTPDKATDTWASGDPYERYIGRWSRKAAPQFLAWLGVGAGRRWLDVGCGTGALSSAILDRCAPSFLVGVEPSAGFLATARKHLGARAALAVGNATVLPLGDAAVDATVSGLVLNFIPDRPAALAEMARVTSDGGTVGAYVWDYAGKMELLRHFWDAAVELDPAAARLDEGPRFPLCRPDALAALFRDAGYADVEITTIDVATPFGDFDDYWAPFLGGQGPAPTYVMALDESARTKLRDRLRARIPAQPDGSLALVARAFGVRAKVIPETPRGRSTKAAP